MSSFHQRQQKMRHVENEEGSCKEKEQLTETVPEEVPTLDLWNFIPYLTLGQMPLCVCNLHNYTW